MASEKAMYWAAVAVLAFGVTNGFLNDHAEWADHLADRSIAMMAPVFETAMRFATLADVALGDNGSGHAQMALVRTQARLACAQSAWARRQAGMARLQAARIRMRLIEQGHGTVVVCPRFTVDLPQPVVDGRF
jgi:hypothetical protein